MSPLPGWYPDPAAPDTQRYWDGEQWMGRPLPADATPPPGPPPVEAEPVTPAAPPEPPDAPPAWTPTPGSELPRPGPEGASGPRPGAWFPPTSRPGRPDQPGGPGQPPLPPVPPGHIRLPGSTAAIPIDASRLAPLGLRLLARLIDIVSVFVLCAIVNGYFWVKFAQEVSPAVGDILSRKETLSPEASRLNWIILLLTIGLWFAYEVPATANSGQTLGKRIVGIRVIRVADEKMLTFGQSIRRWLILMLPSPAVSFACGLPLQLADLLWCLFDKPARQCLHDKAVTSMVVRSRSVSDSSAVPDESSDVKNHR